MKKHRCEEQILQTGCNKGIIQGWLTTVEHGDTNVALLKPFQNLSFEVMCRATCSWDTNEEEEENKFLTSSRTILDMITSGSKMKFLFKIFPFIDYLPFGPGVKKKKAIEEAHEEILKIMAKRKQEMASGTMLPEHERDFLSCMFRAQQDDPDYRMSDRCIHDNIFTFLLGAFETTSTTLMWCVYVFGIYPHVQTKSRDEVIATLGSRDTITVEDINAMKYLTCVIKETLRVYNASIRVGRVTTRECTLGNYWLPKGQMVKTVFNLFHMNEELFPRADEFIPERFSETGSIKPGSWLAFGYGPYNCIGQKFAMNELRVVLAKLLLNFRFSVDADKRRFKRTIQVAVRASPEVIVRVEKI